MFQNKSIRHSYSGYGNESEKEDDNEDTRLRMNNQNWDIVQFSDNGAVEIVPSLWLTRDGEYKYPKEGFDCRTVKEEYIVFREDYPNYEKRKVQSTYYEGITCLEKANTLWKATQNKGKNNESWDIVQFSDSGEVQIVPSSWLTKNGKYKYPNSSNSQHVKDVYKKGVKSWKKVKAFYDKIIIRLTENKLSWDIVTWFGKEVPEIVPSCWRTAKGYKYPESNVPKDAKEDFIVCCEDLQKYEERIVQTIHYTRINSTEKAESLWKTIQASSTCIMLNKLRLIVWKNFIIRKRHWFLTIIEILIPVVLFTLTAYGRSKIIGFRKVNITEATTYDVESEFLLSNHVPTGQLTLWYAPYTEFTEKIIQDVQIKFQIEGEAVKEFVSEAELLKHYNGYVSNGITVIGVVFNTKNPKQLSYDLRIHEKYLTWDTDKLYNSFATMEDTGSSNYVYKGFAGLQIAINNAYMKTVLDTNTLNTTYSVQRFPYRPHIQDSGINELFLTFLPLFTILSFGFLFPAVLQRVIEEKASGIMELMRMVGLKGWMLWFGWFIHGLFTNFLSILVIVCLMKAPLWGVEYPPIEYCSGTVLFVFLLLYCMAAIVFCFMISSLFSRPSVGMVVGILVWIFSYFVPKAILSNYETMSKRSKLLVGFFPNMALQYGYSAIFVYETSEVGVQWTNLHQSGTDGEDDITMLDVFGIFLVDMIIFMLLTIYIEIVNPGEHGIAKPLYFPLQTIINKFHTKVNVEEPMELESFIEKSQNVEEPCIKIRHLRKQYPRNVAVVDLSMDIYKNQITVLLGENGAGKTTTMSIMTGMISATSGFVQIGNKDINRNIDQVRQRMGLCPQHNLLFPDLTVKEHLKFFAMLKGRSSRMANQEAETIARELNLSHRKDNLASTLSGGMKRKLCLGMALIGDSEILVLDEPTSGMDPESRRKMWDFLLELRKSKTIVITTHFMDEADAIGDWISIMYKGQLQCYGTPMFLKNKYNTGYHLSLMLSPTGMKNKGLILENIKRTLPEATSVNENGCSIVLQLPMEKTQDFSHVFKNLETAKESFGIEKMGLTITTLNDVFLKAKADTEKNGDKSPTDYKALKNEKLQRSCWNNWRSLFLKRLYFTKRKYLFYIPGILVGLTIFLATFILGQVSADYSEYGGPALVLTLEKYGKTGVYYNGSYHLARVMDYYKDVTWEQGSTPNFVPGVPENIIARGVENSVYYKQHMVAAAEFKLDGNNLEINCLYSGSALHSVPISINLAMNAVVKDLLGKDYSIVTRNFPLQTLYTDFLPSQISETQVGVLWLVLIPIGALFLMSSFIVFPSFELTSNFIQIQLMAGVTPFVYWLSNIIFDFILFVLKAAIVFGILIAVNLLFYQSFGTNELVALIALFASYALATLPFTYLFSYKKSISGGFALYIILGMFLGLVPAVVVGIMEFSEDDYYVHIASILKIVFMCICPQSGLSYFCVKFARKFVENYNWDNMESDKKNDICKTNPTDCCFSGDSLQCSNYRSYFANDKLGFHYDLYIMLASSVIYFLILCVMETRIVKILECWWSNFIPMLWPSCKKEEENEKMDHEKISFLDYMTLKRSNSHKTEKSNDGLNALEIKKCLGGKQIVNNATIRVKKGNCYGLLGVNGAGKTTTFKMLTANLLHDDGRITMNNGGTEICLLEKTAEYCQNIGYCPQEDYLNFALTGRELITIVAYMKGHLNTKEIADKLIELFDLREHADKPSAEYSGGNKRKLNTALAFVGFPGIILLDEPTSGVDPAGRRKFWNTLSHVKNNEGTSFVLCSHSMEECEALSDYVGIMKTGKIEAEGSLLHLKDKYEKGFTINFKLNLPELKRYGKDDVDSTSVEISSESGGDTEATPLTPLINGTVKRDIEEVLGSVELKEEHLGLLSYHIKDTNKRLSDVFKEAEQLKRKYPFIEDYTITEASLEDVFLNIAKGLNKP